MIILYILLAAIILVHVLVILAACKAAGDADREREAFKMDLNDP